MTSTQWFVADNDSYYSVYGRSKAVLKIDYKVKKPTSFTFLSVLGYSFDLSTLGTLYDPMIGRVVAATQEIANAFPRWTTIRMSPASNGQKLMNSFGQNMEFIYEQLQSMRREQYPRTADKRQIYQLNKIADNRRISDVIRNSITIQSDTLRNLLGNSDFSILQPVRTNKAWKWKGQYTVDQGNTLHGSYSVRLLGSGCVYQQIPLSQNISSGEKIIFGGWTKTDASQDVDDVDVYSALIHLIYEDDTREIVRAAIPVGTSSTWETFSISAVPTKNVIDIEVQVSLRTNDYITYVNVDCLQVEVGNRRTEWIRRFDDYPIYLNSAQVPVVEAARSTRAAQKISVWMVDNDYDFINKMPPTRLELTHVQKDMSASVQRSWSRMIDHNGNLWPTKWSIYNNEIIRENEIVANETYYTYDIAEISPDSRRYTVYTDVTRTMLSLTTLKDILVILCKEQYGGSTIYCLKFLRPFVSKHNKGYLECIADIRVDLEKFVSNLSPFNRFSSSANGYSIAYSDSEDDILIIRIPGGRLLAYQLYYDYGYIDTSKFILYLRENYPGYKVIIT